MQQQTYNFFIIYLHNFKLKSEVIIDYKSWLLTELKKFRVIWLLHFYKGILLSNVAKLSFQKLQYL